MMQFIKRFKLPALALLLLVSVGVISKLPPLRLDLTHDKLFTLSDDTLRLLDKLDGDPVHLTFYYSDKVTQNIPTLRAYARRVKETLREYERRSHGKIVLTIVDPEPFSEEEDQATSLNLQGIPVENNDMAFLCLVA